METRTKVVTKKKVTSQQQPNLTKRIMLTLLKLVISGLLLFWALRKTNLEEVFLALSSAHLPLLGAASLVYLFSYYIRSRRWSVLLEAQDVFTTIPVLFKSYLISIFFGNFLPSTVGGDVVRAYDSWRLGASKSVAAATVFVDRFLGLVTLTIFAVGGLIFSPQLSSKLNVIYPWLVCGAIVLLLLCVLFWQYSHQLKKISAIAKPFSAKLQQLLDNIVSAFLTFGNHKDALIKAVSWSLVVQISVISHYYLIAKALGLTVPFHNFFVIIPVATLIMMLPVSINAIGLRENAFVFLLGLYNYGIARSEAVAFAWLAYAIVILQGIIGGILYGLRK